MCDVCRMQICPPRCPGFDGRRAGKGEAVGRCAICQSLIYKGESRYSDGERSVCEDCARYIDVDGLVDLCDFEGSGELLGALGFVREAAE